MTKAKVTIEDTRIRRFTLFGELAAGEFFLYQEDLYVKTDLLTAYHFSRLNCRKLPCSERVDPVNVAIKIVD